MTQFFMPCSPLSVASAFPGVHSYFCRLFILCEICYRCQIQYLYKIQPSCNFEKLCLQHSVANRSQSACQVSMKPHPDRNLTLHREILRAITTECHESPVKSLTEKFVFGYWNYGSFSKCSLTWNIKWSALGILGPFYSDYTVEPSGTRFWPGFLPSPELTLGCNSSPVLVFFDFLLFFLLLRPGMQDLTSTNLAWALQN